MARPTKLGFQYFPLDTTFFNDIRIKKLIRNQGGGGVTIYVSLLCMAYQNGYYVEWDAELPFMISVETGFDEEYVKQAVEYCISAGLFSRNMFDKHNVLTSKSIQNRYLNMVKTSRRNTSISSELTLINAEETRVIAEETKVITEETGVNSGKGTQSKIKKSKVNKSTKEINISFDVAWSLWGKKKGDKIWCVKHWEGVLTDKDRTAIIEKIPLYLATLDPKDTVRKYQLNFKTYLGQRRWETDEYEEVKTKQVRQFVE